MQSKRKKIGLQKKMKKILKEILNLYYFCKKIMREIFFSN